MSESPNTTGGLPAQMEASWLYRLIGQEESTIEELRELIIVPPETERALRAFAQANTTHSSWVEAALKFRKAVAGKFERLVSKGDPEAESPEIKEPELAPRRNIRRDAAVARCKREQDFRW